MNIMRSTALIAVCTVISRITGYAREILMSHFIGANYVSDALAMSLKFPAIFRRLFAEGAFNVSFLPLFSKSQKDSVFSGMALSFLIAMVGSLVVLALFFFKPLVYFFQSINQLSTATQSFSLLVIYGPIVFPYIFFISVTAFFGCLLNVNNRFGCLAFSHAFANIIVIGFVGVGSYFSSDYGLLFACGFVVSSIIQCLFVVGYSFWRKCGVCPLWPHLTPWTKMFLKKFWPGLLGTGLTQVNSLVGLYFAVLYLPVGTPSILHYADRLNQLPISIVGISLSSILLPLLSNHIATGHVAQANSAQDQGLKAIFLLGFPTMFCMFTLSEPLVYLLYGGGKLTATQLTYIAQYIALYGLGLPAILLIKILNTRFFAQGQTWIPLLGSAVGVFVDIVCSFVLVGPLAHRGLALAIGGASWASALFLIGVLLKQKHWSIGASLRQYAFWTFGAATMSGAAGAMVWRYGIPYIFSSPVIGFSAYTFFHKIWLLTAILSLEALIFALILQVGGLWHFSNLRPAFIRLKSFFGQNFLRPRRQRTP